MFISYTHIHIQNTLFFMPFLQTTHSQVSYLEHLHFASLSKYNHNLNLFLKCSLFLHSKLHTLQCASELSSLCGFRPTSGESAKPVQQEIRDFWCLWLLILRFKTTKSAIKFSNSNASVLSCSLESFVWVPAASKHFWVQICKFLENLAVWLLKKI